MSYKDTLTLYEELVDSGVSDAQAKIVAHQHGELGDELANTCKGLREDMRGIKTDLNNMDKKMDLTVIELKTEMKWMRIIGGAMTFAFLANFIKVWMMH